MKTKTIFKTLALAMMMPAMMLTTACSSDDDAIVNNPENNNQKGYAIPVTVNVTRQGDATTRATYDDSEKKLSFGTGDKLFVLGTDNVAGRFAGTLDYVPASGQFSGTIYTANTYSGTADALLSGAEAAGAVLLPSGYEDKHFLTLSGEGCSAVLTNDNTKAFAATKAEAVEQFSYESAIEYSNGFALAPKNAILNFTAVTGQWGGAPASSSVSLQAGETTVSGSVAPVEGGGRALAIFAIAVAGGTTPSDLTLTVDGTSVSLGSHTLAAGKIYNQKCANFNVTSPLIQANEKWLVYGTGASSGWRLSVAEGATVTLSNVNLSDASIVCSGNNTIILADGTTNSVTDAGHIGGPAIMYMGGVGTTLTITGTGTLNVTGGYDNPAIGPMGWDQSCGDITIENTVHLTATKGDGINVSKAITTNGGGTVTIGGTVYPDGADSPFTYPAPAGPVTYTLAESTVGMVVGTDGLAYDVADKDNLPTGVTAAGVIVYKNGSNGLVIALTDEANEMDWNTANGASGAAAHTPAVEGQTWKLPSQEEWTLVKNNNSGTNLNTAIENAGGTAIPTLRFDPPTGTMAGQYWLSTENSSYTDIARVWGINSDDEIVVGDANQTLKTDNILVRACLAF